MLLFRVGVILILGRYTYRVESFDVGSILSFVTKICLFSINRGYSLGYLKKIMRRNQGQ
jgi:hypothetical protein